MAKSMGRKQLLPASGASNWKRKSWQGQLWWKGEGGGGWASQGKGGAWSTAPQASPSPSFNQPPLSPKPWAYQGASQPAVKGASQGGSEPKGQGPPASQRPPAASGSSSNTPPQGYEKGGDEQETGEKGKKNPYSGYKGPKCPACFQMDLDFRHDLKNCPNNKDVWAEMIRKCQ